MKQPAYDATSPQVSIIVPTYNESQNILDVLRSIADCVPKMMRVETIVVDDDSPDGTGGIVDEYIAGVRELANNTINIIHRKAEKGLSSAILSGIRQAAGETIVVMDSDMSHPPSLIPKLLEAIRSKYDLAIASRYADGGTIEGWDIRRKLISRTATQIAKRGLGIDTADPMSGFFAFRKKVIKDLKFDAIGYKMLLEILVKADEISIAEIPYTFTDRRLGASKLGVSTAVDYLRSVWRLYRHGGGADCRESRVRRSARFVSKAARFFTVGASGFGVNYLTSLLFAGGGVADLWYLHANMVGIAVSMTGNFVLNKVWTFGDRGLVPLRRTAAQYLKFAAFSSVGALAQLGMVYGLVDGNGVSYPLALMASVAAAGMGNFIMNKRWTFGERVWG